MMRRIRENKELEEDWPMRRIPAGTNRHNLSPTTMPLTHSTKRDLLLLLLLLLFPTTPLTHSTKRDLWIGGDGVGNDDDGVHRWLFNDAHRVHHYHTFITIALMHWATLDDSVSEIFGQYNIFFGQYNTILIKILYFLFAIYHVIIFIFISYNLSLSLGELISRGLSVSLAISC